MNKQFLSVKGYTLIEVMVVLGLVGILGLIAIPSFAQQIKQGRVTSHANQLQSVFKFARSEAAKRSEEINLVVNGTQWEVKMGTEVLSIFEPSNDSITITGLTDLTISATGSISEEKEFKIEGADASTDIYYLCAYTSGQTKLLKGTACS